MVVVVVVFESNVAVVVVVLVASESFVVAVVDKTKVVVKLENSVVGPVVVKLENSVVGPVVFEKNRPVVVELMLLEFSVVVGNVVDAVVVVVVVVVELSWELAVLLQTRTRQDTAKIIPQPCSISQADLLHSSMSGRAEERPDNF